MLASNQALSLVLLGAVCGLLLGLLLKESEDVQLLKRLDVESCTAYLTARYRASNAVDLVGRLRRDTPSPWLVWSTAAVAAMAIAGMLLVIAGRIASGASGSGDLLQPAGVILAAALSIALGATAYRRLRLSAERLEGAK